MFGGKDWDDFKHESKDKKIVTVNINGVFNEGKTLYVELDWELESVLQSASQRLEIPPARRIFNADGVEINDSMMIEDDDILFFSDGEDFISPLDDVEDENAEGGETKDEGGGSSNLPSSIGGYKVSDFLGKGAFGEVRLGEHPLNDEKVALKFVNKRDILTISAAERTMTEIQCLATLKHPNIITLYQHVETPSHVVLIFELMNGGDLLSFMVKRGPTAQEMSLPEDVARSVFTQLVNAVSYAHNQHICHRDLKLENILLKHNSLEEIKVADFGLSDFYRPGSTRKSNCGTLSFLAPEGLRSGAKAGPPLDVWSLGVILFSILSGRLPFAGDLNSTRRPREQVIRNKIMKCQYRLDDSLGIEVKDLIRRILKLDPGERASVPEVINHIWIRSGAITSDSCLSSSSRSRSNSKNLNWSRSRSNSEADGPAGAGHSQKDRDCESAAQSVCQGETLPADPSSHPVVAATAIAVNSEPRLPPGLTRKESQENTLAGKRVREKDETRDCKGEDETGSIESPWRRSADIPFVGQREQSLSLDATPGYSAGKSPSSGISIPRDTGSAVLSPETFGSAGAPFRRSGVAAISGAGAGVIGDNSDGDSLDTALGGQGASRVDSYNSLGTSPGAGGESGNGDDMFGGSSTAESTSPRSQAEAQAQSQSAKEEGKRVEHSFKLMPLRRMSTAPSSHYSGSSDGGVGGIAPAPPHGTDSPLLTVGVKRVDSLGGTSAAPSTSTSSVAGAGVGAGAGSGYAGQPVEPPPSLSAHSHTHAAAGDRSFDRTLADFAASERGTENAYLQQRRGSKVFTISPSTSVESNLNKGGGSSSDAGAGAGAGAHEDSLQVAMRQQQQADSSSAVGGSPMVSANKKIPSPSVAAGVGGAGMTVRLSPRNTGTGLNVLGDNSSK
jgi:serine/threonine protein kinase